MMSIEINLALRIVVDNPSKEIDAIFMKSLISYVNFAKDVLTASTFIPLRVTFRGKQDDYT